MKQWVNDAIGTIQYFDLDRFEGDITFEVVAEPSAPGHKDIMCTVFAPPNATVQIRQGFDEADSLFQKRVPGWPATVKSWFMECVIHEISHAWIFSQILDDSSRAAVCGYFLHTVEGGGTSGLLADWNPLGSAWEERIQEASAEAMKDIIMPEIYRVYDNRTNWTLRNSAARLSFTNRINLSSTGAHHVHEIRKLYNGAMAPGQDIVEAAEQQLDHALIGYFASPIEDDNPLYYWSTEYRNLGLDGNVYTYSGANIGGLGFLTAPNRFYFTNEEKNEISSQMAVGDVDLTMNSGPVVPAGYLPSPFTFLGIDPATDDVEYVGWEQGYWFDRATAGGDYYQANGSPSSPPPPGGQVVEFIVGWFLIAPGGGYYKEYPLDALGPANLLAPYQYREVLTGQTPIFSGSIAVPPASLDVEGHSWLFSWHVFATPGDLPAGPGVIEDWGTRNWTLDYDVGTMPPPIPEPTPPFIAVGDGPGDALRIGI